MYHNISDPPADTALKSLYVTPRMFRFQMWYLKRAGFRVVSLGTVLDFVKGAKPEERLVALTFDDGYEDFYRNAYPVLKEYKYPSTVFLVADFIGKENLWDCKEPGGGKKLLDWDMIMEMKNSGVSFGSHTRTHPFLSRLTKEQIEQEVVGSKMVLEQRLGTGVDFFCYPYGNYDERVLAKVTQAGYLGAVTTKRGPIYRGDNPFEMSRSFIRHNTHPLSFIYKFHSGYEDRMRRKG